MKKVKSFKKNIKIISGILVVLFVLLACNTKPKPALGFIQSPLENVKASSLLEHVQLAINPNFENWVLFENGTYIIFDDLNGISDVQQEAIRLMKEYGPVSLGGPSGDFGVTHLNKTEGWVVSGHGYGMYTYVHPSELNQSAPDDSAIGLFGRSKRARDANDLKFIHVNPVNK